MLSRIRPADIAAAQATAQSVTDMVVLVLAAVKSWLEALNALEAGGAGDDGLVQAGVSSGWLVGRRVRGWSVFFETLIQTNKTTNPPTGGRRRPPLVAQEPSGRAPFHPPAA
jgi:hypothetical protein